MTISKTRVNRKMRRKTSSALAETIFQAKKNKNWVEISNVISAPRRLQSSVNLETIDRETKEGDTILIPGKVLAGGDVTKKIRVVALYFSEGAIRKLKAKKCEAVTVSEEIKVNPSARGIKVLK